VGLPDNDTAPLFALLEEREHPSLVRIAREGEAFALASGLWLGGATPALVIQNTGLLESGDALRGTTLRMGVPLVMVVGYRGFAKMRAVGRDPHGGPFTPEELMRPELDGVALMTEPTLMAWGVPYALLGGEGDRARIAEAFEHARRERRARALLLTHTLG
jgi:sulfopyruvate decarboxylase subunit alpha